MCFFLKKKKTFNTTAHLKKRISNKINRKSDLRNTVLTEYAIFQKVN